MKIIIRNIVLYLVLLFMFSYCTTNTERETNEQGVINWNDNKAILTAAENYYKDSTVKINRASLFVQDKRRKLKRKEGISEEEYKQRQAKLEKMLALHPRFAMRHLTFVRADTANLHVVGRELAWLPVVMRDKGTKNPLKDSLVVDYKIIWDEGTITFIGDRKIVGAFRVTEVVIQEADGEKRYEWIEDDGYWEKQLVKSPDM